ncbi:MAG: methyltransferase domain-containing protein [Acidobacteria bacterium]|nr:methyltransferase domain-containing protein [Acidobacteriota bacterium]
MGANYYRSALARVHHEGFAGHADACAPGILARLAPVRERGGLVLELGCGSGALTRHLVAAGHRVVATDASPAMVALAREAVPGAEAVRRLTLPDDPLPAADAVVSVGHVLSYLPDVPSVARALRAVAAAVRPGGVVAVDLLDRAYRAARAGKQPVAAFGGDWAVLIAFASPDPETYVRDIATFMRNADGTWRRDDERHVNVLVDAAEVSGRLAAEGLVDVEVARGFDERQVMEEGLVAIIGVRRHAVKTGRGFEPRAVTNSS